VESFQKAARDEEKEIPLGQPRVCTGKKEIGRD
jgi:hypothetical protein